MRPLAKILVRPRVLLLALLPLLLVPVSSSAQVAGRVWFVQAGADGNGATAASPVGSTRELESVTGPGDVLVLLPSEAPLAGGLALKAGQTLIGLPEGDARPVLTNADSSRHGGVGLVLTTNTRVLNVRIEDTYASGILGTNTDGILIDGVQVSGANQSGSFTTAVINAMGTPISHGGIVVLAEGPETTARSTVSRTAVIDAAGTGIVAFATGGAQNRLTIQETHVEGGARVGQLDVGVGVVAEGPGTEAELLLADSEVRGRRSLAARNVIAFASADASSSVRLERSLVADSGQDGVIGVAALTPAHVDVKVVDSVVEGSAQTNVEGTILNLPASDPSRAHEARMSLTIVGSTLRGAGTDAPAVFEGQGRNVFLGSSAIAQQMDSTATAPFPPGTYELEVLDSRLTEALDHGLAVGNSGAKWGIEPEEAAFDVRLRGNRITSNGSAAVAVSAPRAMVGARGNCWGTPEGMTGSDLLVEAPAERSQVDASDPLPCEGSE